MNLAGPEAANATQAKAQASAPEAPSPAPLSDSASLIQALNNGMDLNSLTPEQLEEAALAVTGTTE